MSHRAATPPLGTQPRRNAQADLRTVVTDLLSGQYRYPLRVVAFNTADGWIRDVSAEIACQVLSLRRSPDLIIESRRYEGLCSGAVRAE